MIRVLLLDLGGTLTDGQNVFPHVSEALSTLAGFETESGEPLPACLVSDFKAPASSEDVATIFGEYVDILRGLQLDDSFQPLEERVTLSTQAGVRKPDRRIFELALRRLRSPAKLSECLFITEDEAHIAACRALGMQTLRFGTDFDDWADAPALVAHLVAPDHSGNLQAAVRTRLAAVEGMDLVSVEPGDDPAELKARAHAWIGLGDQDLGDLNGVHVKLPVSLRIQRDSTGRVGTVQQQDPPAEEKEEAAYMIRSLKANRQVQTTPGPPGPGITHTVRTDARGRRVLQRNRFSAI